MIPSEGSHRNGIGRPEECPVTLPMSSDEIVRKYSIGTPSDTPASLRSKAADFLRMAGEARELRLSEELRLLAALYLERAAELEKAAAVALVVTPEPKQEG